jgi:hypothetical protein
VAARPFLTLMNSEKGRGSDRIEASESMAAGQFPTLRIAAQFSGKPPFALK